MAIICHVFHVKKEGFSNTVAIKYADRHRTTKFGTQLHYNHLGSKDRQQ